MTLFEAQPYDAVRARKKRNIILAIIAAIIVIAVLLWLCRFWPEKHVVAQFFLPCSSRVSKRRTASGCTTRPGSSILNATRAIATTTSLRIGPGRGVGHRQEPSRGRGAVPSGDSGSPFARASGVVVVVTVNERVAERPHLGTEGRQDAGLLAILAAECIDIAAKERPENISPALLFWVMRAFAAAQRVQGLKPFSHEGCCGTAEAVP